MFNFVCITAFISEEPDLISLFTLLAGGKLPAYIKTAVGLVETAVPETLEK